MSLAIVITMGSVSIGGAIIEKVLMKVGKSDESQMVGVATTSMIIATAVTAVVEVFNSVRKLG